MTARTAGVLRRVPHVVRVALGSVLMLPAAGLLLVFHVAHRLVGLDPLDVARSRPGTWVTRLGDDAAPGRGHIEVRWRGHRSRFPRVRRVSAIAIAMALVAVPLFVTARASVAPKAPEAAAAAGYEDWPQLWAETHEFLGAVDFSAVTTFKPRGYVGRYVNQTPEGRSTWQPPACDCPRHRVWFFGGSAAWGQYQQDMNTIPSALARAAWKRGIALEVRNLGVPSFTLGQEVRRFGHLATVEPPPHVAVFYDGVNDLALQNSRNGRGLGHDESQASLLEVPFGAVLDLVNGGWTMSGFKPSADGAGIVDTTPTGPKLDHIGVAHHALRRYERDRELAGVIAAGFDVEPLFFWQPTIMSSRDDVDVYRSGGSPDGFFADVYLRAADRLPDDVVDLSGALRGRTEDFFDGAHHNERAAQLLAEMMLPSVLAALDDSGR